MNEAHKRFCDLYLEHFNATKAYQEVYKDSSYDAARSSASSLLKENPEVQEYIKNRLAELTITNNEVLIGIAAIARNPEEKTADRLKAYDMLAKIGAMYLDRMDVTTAGQRISWEQIIQNEGKTVSDVRGTSLFSTE